jgi:hypothetical protein
MLSCAKCFGSIFQGSDKPKDTFIPKNTYWLNFHYINSSVILWQAERHTNCEYYGNTVLLQKLYIYRGIIDLIRNALNTAKLGNINPGGGREFHSIVIPPPFFSFFPTLKNIPFLECCLKSPLFFNIESDTILSLSWGWWFLV